MTKKSFVNPRHNVVHLNFPNGNHISTRWGRGSYTENYDFEEAENVDSVKEYRAFIGSMDVEIMFSCGDKLKKRILKKYNDRVPDPIGYLDIGQWLEIVNLLAKERISNLERGER